MNFAELFSQGDALTRVVAVLLLAMSVASWVVILWKSWLLRRAARDVSRSTAAFWQSASVDQAWQTVGVFDREALVLPLIAATQLEAAGSLAAAGDRSQQLTRLLRDALHQVLDKLQFGQVLLASVGSTAPFVGLLGTVWGIYHALTGIATAGQITIDKVAGPVGEALIMTAAGLAVAIPAVLGYNVFGRLIGRIEADLEGFARDLRELLTHATLAPGSDTSAAGPPQEARAPSGGSAAASAASVGAL
ncbi:MAG TPA: MotA/TolQ/ExbB proton channel family protein [Ramlibacter sp.]|nr:MotA/TolQ/ExbB proton channel family protein [Ramlibacter sp.]